ncbi:hypothetical protein HZS55_01965 [Halosimplex rubrum]|uniref:DUF7577 domain-containing protein n=1 Tax=Halosimplex rubrum TaxID=869889 RepID=A0A7D5P224_9EURY|nr:hypothetical protein [Halosimplex rubrum]QLH76144.1 hypothetical protein HZS55_01965 [Halosimplex rubrum]
MEPWGWILVYLAGFTLLQLLLVRYFSEDRSLGGVSLESNEASPPQSGDRGRSVGERDPRSPEEADEGDGSVRCHQCGTANADEQSYTYCRECLAQIR